MNSDSLRSKTKSELLEIAKTMGLRGLTATKKDLIIVAILDAQRNPTIVVNPPPVAPPAPLPSPQPNMSHAERDEAEEDAFRRFYVPPLPRQIVPGLPLDHQKLMHLFTFLKPASQSPEWRLLQMLYLANPSSFVLSAGHVTPFGDQRPHYTLNVSMVNPRNQYRIWNNYHCHYESINGKEHWTTITNPQQQIICDFRQGSS